MTEHPLDNWRHRSEDMRCGTCMWWLVKAPVDKEGFVQIGRCRRHAPTMSGFPVTFQSDWCGDHKLDEEKLST